MLLRGYDGLSATRGPDDGFTTRAAVKLVDLYEVMGDGEDVEQWRSLAGAGSNG